MAQSAQSPATTATVSSADPEIKQESNLLEGLGFSMSPEAAMKRPLEHTSRDERVPEPKRVKTETAHESEEGSVEDGLALLIQNTLANINDLVGNASGGPDDPTAPRDPIDVDSLPAPEATPAPPAPVTFTSDPEKYIQHTNIYALGNLAISFLVVVSQRPVDETIKWLGEADSDHAQSLRRLRLAFDATRNLYSTDTILVADPFESPEADSRTILELANLARLGNQLLKDDLASLADADSTFLSVFSTQLSDLPEAVTELYLAIKTQRALKALVAKEPHRTPDEVISEALIDGLEDRLRERNGGQDLTVADQTLVFSVKLRQEALREDVQEQTDHAVLIPVLTEKYRYTEVLRLFSICAKKQLALATNLGDKLGVAIPIADETTESEVEAEAEAEVHTDPTEMDTDMIDLDDLSSFFEKTTSGLVQNALAGLTEDEPAPAPTIEGEEAQAGADNATPKLDDSTPQTNGKVDFMTDYKELEALVAESTADYVKTTLNGLSPVPYQPTVPASTAESMAAQTPYLSHLQQHQPQNSYYSYSQPVPDHQVQQPGPGGILPPNQSLTSAMLYDKARQAALSKSSAHTRREGLHSTRRPWTQEEEKALMAGLDMVKGPHWSQILTLFGQNGTISDILKERTQVQLKDKARNLKLFFLKTNSEMPYYLQAVTGELKTRAPTQAARKEAEERARMNSEEDQAKLQGIMALAGGLQHPPQRSSGSPSVPSNIVTPAQAASAVAQIPSSVQSTAMQAPSSVAHTHTAPAGPLGASSVQPKPPSQIAAQQALQSMPQAPPRPQNQLPPHIPRPQTQQQHQQPQNGHSAQPAPPVAHHAQAHAQPRPQSHTHSHPHTPTTTPLSRPPPPAQQTVAPQAAHARPAQPQQTQQTPSLPAPPTQPAASAAPAQKQTQPAQVNHLLPPPPPAPQQATQNHDNSAEAALLKGLQAVVAETSS